MSDLRAGDYARCTGGPLVGLRVRVAWIGERPADDGTSEPSGTTRCEPLTPRPDGFGMSSFIYPLHMLERSYNPAEPDTVDSWLDE